MPKQAQWVDEDTAQTNQQLSTRITWMILKFYPLQKIL
jgi:hypothetical protein